MSQQKTSAPPRAPKRRERQRCEAHSAQSGKSARALRTHRRSKNKVPSTAPASPTTRAPGPRPARAPPPLVQGQGQGDEDSSAPMRGIKQASGRTRRACRGARSRRRRPHPRGLVKTTDEEENGEPPTPRRRRPAARAPHPALPPTHVRCVPRCRAKLAPACVHGSSVVRLRARASRADGDVHARSVPPTPPHTGPPPSPRARHGRPEKRRRRVAAQPRA